MERTTIRELTCDSVMGRSITGMGMVKYTCAPVMEIPSPGGLQQNLQGHAQYKGQYHQRHQQPIDYALLRVTFHRHSGLLVLWLDKSPQKDHQARKQQRKRAATGWKHGAVSATMATPTSSSIRPV